MRVRPKSRCQRCELDRKIEYIKIKQAGCLVNRFHITTRISQSMDNLCISHSLGLEIPL